MNDEQLDRLLGEAREQYHRPGEPPRDAMWAAIAARRQGAPRHQAPSSRTRLLWWPVGIAALLAVGFALGRGTRPETPGNTTVATTPPGRSAGPSVALTSAAIQHLSQAETFLTGFRLEASARVPDTTLLTGARDLLGTTRLLLDSPGLTDQRTRALLSELEIVLAQVIQLQADPSREDAELIVQELDHQGVLPRLRSSIPAGPAFITTGES